MQHVHAGESGADDDRIKAAFFSCSMSAMLTLDVFFRGSVEEPQDTSKQVGLTQLTDRLRQEIPKPGEFNNMLWRQDGVNERLLRRGVYLI
jgi:hypothetical protein